MVNPEIQEKPVKPFQLHLKEDLPEVLYQFSTGTFIYPVDSSRGILRNPVTAKLTKQKNHGLQVYKSLNRIDLHLGERFWSLPEGTSFGAYRKKRHQIKIK